MARNKKEFDYKAIEFPMRGSTYCDEKYGVYGYGRYERSSVLAGQQRRVFLNSFETLEEAQKAHPDARWSGGASSRVPVSLSHLPGDEDSDPFGDNRDAYNEGLMEGR